MSELFVSIAFAWLGLAMPLARDDAAEPTVGADEPANARTSILLLAAGTALSLALVVASTGLERSRRRRPPRRMTSSTKGRRRAPSARRAGVRDPAPVFGHGSWFPADGRIRRRGGRHTRTCRRAGSCDRRGACGHRTCAWLWPTWSPVPRTLAAVVATQPRDARYGCCGCPVAVRRRPLLFHARYAQFLPFPVECGQLLPLPGVSFF